MKTHLSIPETLAGHKSLRHRLLKPVAALVMAFSSQYAPFVQPKPAVAAVEVGEQERLKLAQLDANFTLVDPERTVQGGVAFMEGSPTMAFPVQNPTTKKLYFMNYVDASQGGDDIPQHTEQLAQVFDTQERLMTYPDAKKFLEYTENQLTGLALTPAEQQRIYFARAFFWGAMGHWLNDGEKTKSADWDVLTIDKGFYAAKASFEALDDGTPWFQDRLKDLSLIEANNKATTMRSGTHSQTAQERDIHNWIREDKYLSSLQASARVMEERTTAMRAGTREKMTYLMDTALFMEVAKAHLEYLEQLPARGWWANQIREEGMQSVALFLPVLMELTEALGSAEDLENTQQRRLKVLAARLTLGYQQILAKNGTHFPESVSAEDMATSVEKNLEVVQGLLTQFGGAKNLYLAEDTQQQTMLAYTTYRQQSAGLELLAAANGTEQKLRALFAKVEGQKGDWTATDKQEWREIYTKADLSPNPKAREAFVRVLQENIVLTSGNVRITRYEETGLEQDIPLMPYYREVNGETIETTVHPVDTVRGEFEIENKTPVSFPIILEMKLPGSDTGVIRERVFLEANKVAMVSYTGNVPIQISRSTIKPVPEAKVQIAMRDVQEVASRTWGEQIALRPETE